jgi:hypothetical protein
MSTEEKMKYILLDSIKGINEVSWGEALTFDSPEYYRASCVLTHPYIIDQETEKEYKRIMNEESEYWFELISSVGDENWVKLGKVILEEDK